MIAIAVSTEDVQEEIKLGRRVHDPLGFVLAEVHPAHHNKAGSNSRKLHPAELIDY